MSIKTVHTHQFEREYKRLCKKYPSFKEDFNKLYEELQKNPRLGEEFLKDCYKIKMAIASKNKGKSGGARVITFFYALKNALCILSAYDKSEKETIEDHEAKILIEEIKEFEWS
jgi:hypothetical protein